MVVLDILVVIYGWSFSQPLESYCSSWLGCLNHLYSLVQGIIKFLPRTSPLDTLLLMVTVEVSRLVFLVICTRVLSNLIVECFENGTVLLVFTSTNLCFSIPRGTLKTLRHIRGSRYVSMTEFPYLAPNQIQQIHHLNAYTWKSVCQYDQNPTSYTQYNPTTPFLTTRIKYNLLIQRE